MISGVLGLQHLGAGLGFPSGDQGWVAAVKALDRSHRPVVTDKGPGPSALQKRTSTKVERSEASTVFY